MDFGGVGCTHARINTQTLIDFIIDLERAREREREIYIYIYIHIYIYICFAYIHEHTYAQSHTHPKLNKENECQHSISLVIAAGLAGRAASTQFQQILTQRVLGTLMGQLWGILPQIIIAIPSIESLHSTI